MTIMVLVVLAAIWAGVLLPPYLQKRRATHPSSSVVDFHQQLAVLQRTGRALDGAELRESYADPFAAQPPAVQAAAAQYGFGYAPQRLGRHEVMRRRRDVFLTLVAAAGLTFVLALALGGSVWLVHLLVDAALLGYVALLLQIQQQRHHVGQPYAAARPRPARRPMSYDDAPRQSSTQQALLRRSAS